MRPRETWNTTIAEGGFQADTEESFECLLVEMDVAVRAGVQRGGPDARRGRGGGGGLCSSRHESLRCRHSSFSLKTLLNLLRNGAICATCVRAEGTYFRIVKVN